MLISLSLLNEGSNRMRSLIDVKTKLTTPALANEFFTKTVYEPNGNLYEVGGHVRQFMSKAVYGGRCMTAYNKKWHTTNKLYDFDAVSLYPSAMRRLWCVEGKPEVLNVPDSSIVYNSMPNYLEKYNTQNGFGAFIIDIQILKANKHYAFPLIIQKRMNPIIISLIISMKIIIR